LYAGAYGLQRTWPMPPGTSDAPVTDDDTYRGRAGPWTGANPNRLSRQSLKTLSLPPQP